MRSVLAECCEPTRIEIRPFRKERHPAQDEGAQQDLAQLGVALHQQPEILAIDGDDGARVLDPPADEAPPRGEHVDLAGELPGPVHDDRLLAIADREHDLDRPLEHHEEARVLLADVEQQLAGRDLAALADRGDARDLRVGQLGEQLRGARQHRIGIGIGIGHRARRIAEPIPARPSTNRRRVRRRALVSRRALG